jgi:uncharacterized protein (TIGR02284 family)
LPIALLSAVVDSSSSSAAARNEPLRAIAITASSSTKPKAVVDEVERGEDHIKAKFEIALKDTDLAPATRGIIRDAFTSVKAGHDQASALKHSLV